MIESQMQNGFNDLLAQLKLENYQQVGDQEGYVLDADDIRKMFFCGAYQALLLAHDAVAEDYYEAQDAVVRMLEECREQLGLAEPEEF